MPAYHLGIIDAHGNVLRHYFTLHTREEQNAYTVLHRFCFNLKKLIEKLPFGKTTIATYAAALYLLKESEDDPIVEELDINQNFEKQILNEGKYFTVDEMRQVGKEAMKNGDVGQCPYCGSPNLGGLLPTDFESRKCDDCGRVSDKWKITEDMMGGAPANNVGSGAIAEPVFPIGMMQRRKKLKKFSEV